MRPSNPPAQDAELDRDAGCIPHYAIEKRAIRDTGSKPMGTVIHV